VAACQCFANQIRCKQWSRAFEKVSFQHLPGNCFCAL
jgi:hypothetical protein